MEKYKFDYDLKLPREIVDGFEVVNKDKLTTQFNINSDMVLQVFEGGIAFCVVRNSEYLLFYSNKPFQQTIKTNENKVFIDFITDENGN